MPAGSGNRLSGRIKALVCSAQAKKNDREVLKDCRIFMVEFCVFVAGVKCSKTSSGRAAIVRSHPPLLSQTNRAIIINYDYLLGLNVAIQRAQASRL